MSADALAAGRAAYRRGDWAEARAAFAATPDLERSASAIDALGRSLWWLGEAAEALAMRGRAFALYRDEGRLGEAAAVAVWLSREHRILMRSPAVAEGWLARAGSVLTQLGTTPGTEDERIALSGWMRLAEAEAATDSGDAVELAGAAVEQARITANRDLEIAALAHLGSRRVAMGSVDTGLRDLHEALVAATAGEGTDPQYVGEALCALLEVSGWLGDAGQVGPWASLLETFTETYDFGPLLPYSPTGGMDVISAFCESCCGAVYLVTGRIDMAESELMRAVARLRATGIHPRCAHPAAQLAELRLAQGRWEEAEALVAEFGNSPECVLALVGVELVHGRAEAGVRRLQEELDVLRDEPVRAMSLWCALVEAALAAGDRTRAGEAAAMVGRVASMTGSRLHAAASLFAQGRLAVSDGADTAPELLRAAARGYAEARATLPACRARLALAEACAATDPGTAVTEARSAMLALERMGATAEADRAAALLRSLGVRRRPAPRSTDVLTRREQDVLRLLAQGLSNNEIAERLVISPKTAGNHVSNILMKLGVRSRTEAAAYAAVQQPVGAERVRDPS